MVRGMGKRSGLEARITISLIGWMAEMVKDEGFCMCIYIYLYIYINFVLNFFTQLQ